MAIEDVIVQTAEGGMWVYFGLFNAPKRAPYWQLECMIHEAQALQIKLSLLLNFLSVFGPNIAIIAVQVVNHCSNTQPKPLFDFILFFFRIVLPLNENDCLCIIFH